MTFISMARGDFAKIMVWLRVDKDYSSLTAVANYASPREKSIMLIYRALWDMNVWKKFNLIMPCVIFSFRNLREKQSCNITSKWFYNKKPQIFPTLLSTLNVWVVTGGTCNLFIMLYFKVFYRAMFHFTIRRSRLFQLRDFKRHLRIYKQLIKYLWIIGL